MQETPVPSDVAVHLGTALDDNLHAPVPVLVQFELALAGNPADETTRLIYRDWLLEHGCTRRAEQLAQDLAGKEVHEYDGPVRPESDYDWSRL